MKKNELTINVSRRFGFKNFLGWNIKKIKSWNIMKMRNKYSITFIGESGIDTGGVSREFSLGFVGIFYFFYFSLILKSVYGDRV